jgi:hypothetical protein
MFSQWIKSLFRKKVPDEVVVRFRLPDGKEIDVTAVKLRPFLEYQNQLHCKDHENYSGATEPINNCNVCWEIYSKKRKSW